MENTDKEKFKKELKALWDCDYKERKYGDPGELEKWDGGELKDENLWVVKGIVNLVEQKDYEKWKEEINKIIKKHNDRAEKSYYYYLSQKNKNINGRLNLSGIKSISLKLCIEKDENDNIVDKYKYYKGSELICNKEELKDPEKTEIERIINDDIQSIRNAKDESTLENIEESSKMPASLRHKLMMMRAYEIYRDQNIENIPMLFVDKGINDYYKKYISGKEKNWVGKNIALTKKIAQIVGIDENNIKYEDIKKMSGLLWDYEHRDELFKEINDDKCKQIIYTGAPGTGKTYGIRRYVKYLCMLDPIEENKTKNEITKNEIKQYKFVQFHSSYDYSDFVEGLRPAILDSNSKDSTFVRMDGVFKSFCRDVVRYNKSVGNKDKKFYFIIDEINRADLGKVFGELMYCLEESYRGDKNPVDTQYRNLPTYYYDKDNKKFDEIPADEDCFRDGFYIPENVYIIGSMNDIDRSVETFDFALRRRFKWINVSANGVMEKTLISMFNFSDLYYIDDEDDEVFKRLVGNIENLNKVISGEIGGEYNGSRFRLSEAYQIGPAYFKNFDGTKDSLDNIWKEKVEPILREYVRGYEKTEIDSFVNLCKEKLIDEKIIKLINGFEDDSETTSENGGDEVASK